VTNNKTIKLHDLPVWFILAKDNASISSKDVADMFGFATYQSLLSSVRKGSFPFPDGSFVAKNASIHSKKRIFWRKSTLLTEWNRRKASQSIVEIT